MTLRVLILGGYGVFGGMLATRLAREGNVDVYVAGRSFEKAVEFCRHFGGAPARIDRSSPQLTEDLSAFSPDIVVDATGPFQVMGDDPYRVAKAAIEIGAHYIDFSDDGGFTEGIAALDQAARAAGVMMVSGASSVPALSSAAVASLAEGIDDIHLIESAILPGNRAPRGLAVMTAILSQVGKSMRIWRGGRSVWMRAWSASKIEALQTYDVSAPIRRRANLIGAPDLNLFPKHFRARSVLFRAGLELPVMHWGLSALGLANRLRLLPAARHIAPALKWIADRLEFFGSEKGGMCVRVIGADKDGALQERLWTLVAEAGDGPQIPAIPAWILIEKIRQGRIAPGASPCLEMFDLDEFVKASAPFAIKTGRRAHRFAPLFEQVLGAEQWQMLPAPLRALHQLADCRIWRGEASIERGTGLLSRLVCALAGFPKATPSCPVEVEMTRSATGEIWTRRFGAGVFRSYLSRSDGAQPVMRERFGLMQFDIGLFVEGGKLFYPVTRGRLLGAPLPGFLLPRSDTHEYVDEAGRACFDVKITMPLVGLVAHYKGWLAPA